MTERNPTAHPYIPNSVPSVKDEMLRAVGAQTVDDFYEDVPQDLRLDEPLDLPPPLTSEYALRRHVEGLLAANRPAGECLSFLGAGCYRHHVPAVCDEINRRGEFLHGLLSDASGTVRGRQRGPLLGRPGLRHEPVRSEGRPVLEPNREYDPIE